MHPQRAPVGAGGCARRAAAAQAPLGAPARCCAGARRSRARRPGPLAPAAIGGAPSPTSSIDVAPGGAGGGAGRGSTVPASALAATASLDALALDDDPAFAAAVKQLQHSLGQQQQQQQQQGAPRRATHGGRGASLLSQEEQEAELLAVGEALPRQEARLEALALWVGAAAAFGAGVWAFMGPEKGQEFFAGYILEQSLSVDNLFVFVLVFSYFKTPPRLQPKVLNYGIATAAGLRAVMVLLGTELVERFEPALLGFALVLLWSAWGLLAGGKDEDEDLSDNKIVKFCRRLLPMADHYDGDRFFTQVPVADAPPASTSGSSAGEPGSSAAALAAAAPARGVGPAMRTLATPLLLALAVVEISDVVFAVDSIPAVFGVTLDPFIVYTSNMFAILSLRSLYAFVSTVMAELKYLDKSVALVLAFIGAKMVAEYFGVEVRTDVSLLTVGALLGGGVAASLLLPDAPEEGGHGDGNKGQ